MKARRDFDLCRLKYVATINDDALGEDTNVDFEMQYVDIGNLDSSGRFHELATYRFEDAPSRARRRVRDGDVIISTVRTYLQAIGHIQKPPSNLIVSTGFAVIRPCREAFDPEFCKYALREPAFLAEVERRSVGVSYPAINASDLENIPIHLPPLPQQRTIAEYLDKATARLDALLAAKERLLALLAQKRCALITHAVTRGVETSYSLRDSGIPWLGRIPMHWKTQRAKWLFTERDERSACGEETLLSLRTEIGLVPHNEVSEKTTHQEELIGYKRTYTNDIVVNRMRAATGLVAVTPRDGLVSPDYAVFSCGESVNPQFFAHLFKTQLLQAVFRSESKGLGTGSSGFLRLHSEDLLSLWLPVPPPSEQDKIAAHITSETSNLDALHSSAERTIARLQERRTALIAASVTGPLDTGRAV